LIGHIFREDNTCVDGLATLGADNLGFSWWDSMPSFPNNFFFR